MDQAVAQPIDSTVLDGQPDPSSYVPPTPSPHQPLARNFMAIGLIIGLVIGAASTYGVMQLSQLKTTSATPVTTPTPTSSPKPSPTPTRSPTADWSTFISRDQSLSFKYPANWSVQTKTVQNPLDGGIDPTVYQQLTITSDTGSPVATFDYPFELVGCDQDTRYRSYLIGQWPTILQASCGEGRFYAFFKAPIDTDYPDPANLMISYYYDPVVDHDFRLLAQSITGLQALVSCIECHVN